MKVYHLIARSEYGLMVQILAGLISYLLMAIYCREEYGEKVSIKRIRELRNGIFNDLCTEEKSNSLPIKANKTKHSKKRNGKGHMQGANRTPRECKFICVSGYGMNHPKGDSYHGQKAESNRCTSG